MERATRAALAAAALALAPVTGAIAGPATAVPSSASVAAPVTWAASSLVIAEIQTGGASASDEFVEIANQGSVATDLAGLEVVYVTASGSTVTRKATWTASTVLDPGRRLLIGNASGVHAGISDAMYSGGFAATGGAVVLRPIGGAPIDAVGWGDATNAFVEGTAAAAPPVGSSLERLPGGIAGNGIDTNDNASDFVIASPNPQPLAAPPVPAPGSTPSPGATPTPEATDPPIPSPELSPEPSEEPTLEPTGAPSPSAAPTLDPTPTPDPTPEPSPVATPSPSPTPEASPIPSPVATPTPSLSPTPIPTASATPAVTTVPIASARLLADGTSVTIEGVLTTRLGEFESGRAAFVEDATGGIALYLDAIVVDGLAAGSVVRVTGTLDDRYAQRTLRVGANDVLLVGVAPLPEAASAVVMDLGEAVEGRRVAIGGVTVGSATAYSDGSGLLVDDGTGQGRVIIVPAALGDLVIPAGTRIVAIGPVGQRDASGTGTTGYRVYVVRSEDLIVLPTPSPTPTPIPTPTPTPLPTPTPTTLPTPTPTATPSPSPNPTPGGSGAIPIAQARTAKIGSTVTVAGVVTAEAGRLGTPSLIAIGDASGAGLVVRVPDGVVAPPRGAAIVVTGPLADPYGQLEIRPRATGWTRGGSGSIPAAHSVRASDLGEGTEARLVSIDGTVVAKAVRATSGDLSVDFEDASGSRFRVFIDASAGIDRSAFTVGTRIRLSGIVGQRATRKGALDGYRVWPRDQRDMVPLSGSAGTGGGSSSGGQGTVTIANAIRAASGTARISGIVTIAPTLLDASGRRVIVQDSTAAIEVLIPTGTTAPAIGARVVVAGEVGLAYGAPRLRAATIEQTGSAALPNPVSLTRAPGQAHEWQLVRVSGSIVDVARLGDKWRAELLMNGVRVAIVGQAGSGIPSTALIEGRRATIVGIVRRPYPSATDRRFAVVPRTGADVSVGPAQPGDPVGSGISGTTGANDVRTMAGSRGGGPGAGAAGSLPTPPDVDLGELADARRPAGPRRRDRGSRGRRRRGPGRRHRGRAGHPAGRSARAGRAHRARRPVECQRRRGRDRRDDRRRGSTAGRRGATRRARAAHLVRRPRRVTDRRRRRGRSSCRGGRR